MTENCVFPPELDDKQLLAYLDGQADETTLSHLQSCAYCREKAETLDRLQNRLTARLYRFDCPSPLELGEYHLHILPASQMLVIGQHVRACPHCAGEVAVLEGFLSDLNPATEGSLLGKAKVLIARLVGPGSLNFAPAAAVRGEGKGPITFAAEGIIIVLDVQPAMEGTLHILGQLAADRQDDWTGALVELRKEGQMGMTSTVDDLGAFHFEKLTPGSIQMTITSPQGVTVRIANIDIGA